MPINEIKNIKMTESTVGASEAIVAPETIDVFSPQGGVVLKDSNGSVFGKTYELKIRKEPEAEDKLDISTFDPELVKRYPAEDLGYFKEFGPGEIKRVKQLAKTQMCAQNVALLALTFRDDEVEKIISRVSEMEKSCGEGNVKDVYFLRDLYDANAYNVIGVQKDNSIKKELVDKNIVPQAVEKAQLYKAADGNSYMEKEAHDYRTNTISKTRYGYDFATKQAYVTHEIRSKMDKDGKMISREYTRPSDIAGVNDIDVLKEGGELEKVSRVKLNKMTGTIKVKKNMESLDGTKTYYSYSDTIKGDRELKYKIVDKDGNVLMDSKKSFQVLGEGRFLSTKNGKEYLITADDKKLKVQEMFGPKREVTFAFSDIKGKKEKMIEVMKQMPGDELFALHETTKSLEGIEYSVDSSYIPRQRSISSGEDLFVVLHELGHAKDYENLDVSSNESISKTIENMISSNKEFRDVYMEEKAAFNKAFPGVQREHIDYFLDSASDPCGSGRCFRETVAETNALSESPMSLDHLSIRAQYLQQYFPRTIAKLSQFL